MTVTSGEVLLQAVTLTAAIQVTGGNLLLAVSTLDNASIQVRTGGRVEFEAGMEMRLTGPGPFFRSEAPDGVAFPEDIDDVALVPNVFTRNGQAVNETPWSTVTLSSSAAPVPFGQPVTFSATIASYPGAIDYGAGSPPPTGTVTFYDGATPLGSVPLATPASLTTARLRAGTHTIFAVYSGDTLYPGSYAILTQAVGNATCADLALVKAAFGKSRGQSGFDPQADVNGDGVVNIRDLAVVSQQLPAGTRCP